MALTGSHCLRRCQGADFTSTHSIHPSSQTRNGLNLQHRSLPSTLRETPLTGGAKKEKRRKQFLGAGSLSFLPSLVTWEEKWSAAASRRGMLLTGQASSRSQQRETVFSAVPLGRWMDIASLPLSSLEPEQHWPVPATACSRHATALGPSYGYDHYTAAPNQQYIQPPMPAAQYTAFMQYMPTYGPGPYVYNPQPYYPPQSMQPGCQYMLPPAPQRGPHSPPRAFGAACSNNLRHVPRVLDNSYVAADNSRSGAGMIRGLISYAPISSESVASRPPAECKSVSTMRRLRRRA
ncbi:hypothetical protein CBER1_07178 [Cercospora berteroae]|uniref:Uncharacterized protein n=1 Tax=Cercospora berteroae TaxID=357750 RepID=A0A2S6BRX7_9PEZI|nr:hypothetical protein CBER1_07178 [Cercospora berteroae]